MHTCVHRDLRLHNMYIHFLHDFKINFPHLGQLWSFLHTFVVFICVQLCSSEASGKPLIHLYMPSGSQKLLWPSFGFSSCPQYSRRVPVVLTSLGHIHPVNFSLSRAFSSFTTSWSSDAIVHKKMLHAMTIRIIFLGTLTNSIDLFSVNNLHKYY